ncbi:MAG TPA: peptidylprolyl isomerase [Armatimonadota bacterium]|nr:peptidylprolyl isomerase [Armatimonadota bacterium]
MTRFTLPLLLLVLGLSGCGEPGQPTGAALARSSNAPMQAPASNVVANAPNAPEANVPAANAPEAGVPAAAGKTVPVTIETSMGTIELELYPDKAPITVANFVQYAKKGFYNGTIFHRVIPGFMIQGGGFTRDMKEKETGAPIKNEAGNGLTNDRGTIAMARTGDPDSATAQFFINVADHASLNHRDDSPEGIGYAVFGKVTKGMDVVDKIVAVPTTTVGRYEDVPKTPVVIKSVKVK